LPLQTGFAGQYLDPVLDHTQK
jgi:hypothetical protein